MIWWMAPLRHLSAIWIGLIICGTKRPNIGKLAEAAEDLSIKQELLDFAAVCEETADNIEDRMPGG